jgi:hypothetical protein
VHHLEVAVVVLLQQDPGLLGGLRGCEVDLPQSLSTPYFSVNNPEK